MSTNASRRLSAVPRPPPTPADSGDDLQDADVSSVSSSGSFMATVRARKARRRWTAPAPAPAPAPSARVHPTSRVPAPIRTDLSPCRSNLERGPNMSPLTEGTVSSAWSTPLHTPDLADWTTSMGNYGGHSLLLDHPIPPRSPTSPTSLTSAARFSHPPPPRTPTGSPAHHPRLSSSGSRDLRFPSPHLDPPLLNFMPGLPPLKLPLADISAQVDTQEYHSPPSPASDAYSTTSLFAISPQHLSHTPSDADPPRFNVLPADPAEEVAPQSYLPAFSPQSVTGIYSPTTPDVSGSDSPILPTGTVAHIADRSRPESVRSAYMDPDIDAFALATAVAGSNHSSFDLPSSVVSVAVLPAVSSGLPSPELPRPMNLRTESGVASTVHVTRDVSSAAAEVLRRGSADHDRTSRRHSTPEPSSWYSPNMEPLHTITSRVDVDVDNQLASGQQSRQKQPVFDSVRKIGSRIRGLFKSKAESKIKRKDADTQPEFGMMTRTTAVTNVEYQSEHPIPSPSPVAKLNPYRRRRSLPPPALTDTLAPVPSSSSMFTWAHSLSAPVSQSKSSLPKPQVPTVDQRPTQSLDDPSRSPHTPKPRRDRTNTNGSERTRGSLFSLTPTAAKPEFSSVRSTTARVQPAPGSRLAELFQDSAFSITTEPESFWGDELPVVQVAETNAEEHPANSLDLSAPFSEHKRMETAPSQTAPKSQAAVDMEQSAANDKRSRRFSLSSLISKRSSRSGPSMSTDSKKGRQRSRTSVIIPAVPPLPADKFAGLSTSLLSPPDSRVSVLSSGAESTYFDAPDHPHDESDLESMSFARMYGSTTNGSFMSLGSSTDRERPSDHGGSGRREASEASTATATSSQSQPQSLFARATHGRARRVSAVAQLVGESESAPVTKTLRFSPGGSFGGKEAEDADADAGSLVGSMRGLEREEDAGFMHALGFEYDEIVRRVREGSI
ncbi:uncharacterized protein BXZ73DRAFT_96919 [Epithele typhae]|uniref:uncharacterized protein n=1 Tax=Epithele typhae TaxID=378194 RepID=UPI0020089282|nr:uncharacterized protein BXZ73DRAFT_96919 [Epithele typhae]KAH9944430.1 hypothetical protein BXZ73DRAFT_96919 [Epithele typhae]